MSTTRTDAGGAAPNCLEASETTLAASITNEGVQFSIENGNWGNDDNIGRKHVFNARPDAGCTAPIHFEVPGTPFAASNTDIGVYLAAAPENGGNDEHLEE